MRGDRQLQWTRRGHHALVRTARVAGAMTISIVVLANPTAVLAQSGAAGAPLAPASAAPEATSETGVHNANVNWIIVALCLLAAVVLLSTIWFWKATKPVPPALGRLSRIDVDELRQLRQRTAAPGVERTRDAAAGGTSNGRASNGAAAPAGAVRPSSQRSASVHSTQRPVTPAGRLPPKRSPSGTGSSTTR
jgi:hypothetical protein